MKADGFIISAPTATTTSAATAGVLASQVVTLVIAVSAVISSGVGVVLLGIVPSVPVVVSSIITIVTAPRHGGGRSILADWTGEKHTAEVLGSCWMVLKISPGVGRWESPVVQFLPRTRLFRKCPPGLINNARWRVALWFKAVLAAGKTWNDAAQDCYEKLQTKAAWRGLGIFVSFSSRLHFRWDARKVRT